MRALLTALLLLPALPAAAAPEIEPARVELSGPRAAQQLVVLEKQGGRAVADLTSRSRFRSLDSAVAVVDAGGMVRPRGEGATRIEVVLGSRRLLAPVRVSRVRQAPAVSFGSEVIPVLTSAGCNSGACHGAAAGKGGLRLTLRGYGPRQDWIALTHQAAGRRVDPARPAGSLALRKATMEIPHGGGPRFKPGSPEYRILHDWIAQGAHPPALEEPRVVRVQVGPSQARLKPGAQMQLLVTADYSDGSRRDVTRLARWTSSADTVASVDGAGRIQVQGHGEAAITVWYSNQVAFARVASPYPGRTVEAAYRSAERRNLIDEPVLRRLRELNIPPAPAAPDETLVRRLYLDVAGVLPSAEEVRRYLADKEPGRYERLVDELLARPEYVDYWAYRWADLLLVSSRKLTAKGMWAFHNWIRTSVAENKPWDAFVRELITASGSTVSEGAANFYVLHKDPIDLTETTSQAFLGVSLTCSRCHNHPLEKWTLNDYYGMANLFARVRLKNGSLPGEMIVMPVATGDVPHLLTRAPVPPRPLDGEPLALDDPGDRRRHLAAWLTSPENSHFSRSLVNRVWKALMGTGLVEAEDDLRVTNPPSNEELLSALSTDFARSGFDIRRLIRLIVTSGAYRRSSIAAPGAPVDTRFYSTYVPRRLPAEVLLDAISQVTGVPSEFAGYPAGTRALQLADSQVASEFLTAFGRPERVQTCSCERQDEPNVAQALHLVNGGTINNRLRKAGSLAEKLASQKLPAEQLVEQIYLEALARRPKPPEKKRVLEILGAEPPGREMIEDLLSAVMTSREFLFNH